MPDLHKTLILAYVRETGENEYEVDELALATEHAPFRHKKAAVEVGGQRKKARTGDVSDKTTISVDANTLNVPMNESTPALSEADAG